MFCGVFSDGCRGLTLTDFSPLRLLHLFHLFHLFHWERPTTPVPIVALEPLPIPLCLGYLAKAAQQHGCPGIAKQAATLVYDRFVGYYGRRSGSNGSNGGHSQEHEEKVVNVVKAPLEENAAPTSSAPTSLVAPTKHKSSEGGGPPTDPYGIDTLGLRNPARAHVLLRQEVARAPLSLLQTFVRSTFVYLDVTGSTNNSTNSTAHKTSNHGHHHHGGATPMAGHPAGLVPDTTSSLWQPQVSRVQSLQRLVCAVEVARVTVLKPQSDVVDPCRPSTGGDLVMEGVVRGYNWLEPLLR